MMVQEFLRQKGAIGLLTVLNERGKTFTEIESEVEITSDTLSKRTDKAIEIGLVEMKAAKRHNRTATEYHLTEFGEEIVQRMALEGVVSNYLDMRTHQRKLEEKTEDVIDWLYENPGQFLEYEEANNETLIDRTEDADSDPTESGEAHSPDGDESQDGTEAPISEDTQTAGQDADRHDSDENLGGGTEESPEDGDDNSQDAEGSADHQPRLADPEMQKRMQEAAADEDTEDG